MTTKKTTFSSTSENDPRYLTSVERTLSILETLSSYRSSLSLTELSNIVDIPLPSLQRMTKILEKNGYLTRDTRTKKYSPAIKAIDLMYNYLASNDFAKKARPHLVNLKQVTGCGVSLSIPSSVFMIYIHRLPNYKGDFENTLPGKRIPMHLSASGRCLLSSLSEQEVSNYMDNTEFQMITNHTIVDPPQLLLTLENIKLTGYSIVKEEVVRGLTSVSVPIYNKTKVVAGISIQLQSTAWTNEKIFQELVPRLHEVSNALKGE